MEPITRQQTGATTNETSTAVVNGWNLTFTTQTDGGKLKSVNVYGIKDQTKSVSASINGSVAADGTTKYSYTVGFHNTEPDADLATALFAELTSIKDSFNS